MVKAQSPSSLFLALWIENALYQGHDFRPTQTLNKNQYQRERGEVAGHFVGGIDFFFEGEKKNHIIWCHYVCLYLFV